VTFGALAALAASSSASDDVGAGAIAFLIVAAMGVALVFLFRSMNKQFHKITPEAAPDGDDQADGTQAKDPARTPE